MQATSNDVDTSACSRSSRMFLNPRTMQPDVTASNPTAHPGASGPKCRIAVSGLPSIANATEGVVSKEVTVSRGSFSCFIVASCRISRADLDVAVQSCNPRQLPQPGCSRADSAAATPGQLAAHEKTLQARALWQA